MLEGDLSDFTLPDILRLLAFTSKSGRLHLEDDRAHGRVDLVEGRVRDASADAKHLPLARRLIGLGHLEADTIVSALQGRDQLPTDLELARDLVRDHELDPGLAASLLREQTVDAVFDLLRWEDGSFRFELRSDADTSPPDLDLKVDDLLAEADQRLEAWPAIEHRTGSGRSVVSISRPSGHVPEIDAEGWGLLGMVDGHRTVDDLVALSGRGQYETRRTLGALVDAGIVTIGEAGRGGLVDQLITGHRALERVESSLQAFAPSAPRGSDPGRTAAAEPAPAADDPGSGDRTYAQRTPSPGWSQPGDEQRSSAPSAPESPPAPDRDSSEPSSSTAPSSEADPEPMPGPGSDRATSDDAAPAVARPEPGRDDNLRMRVRSNRLTTDPNVDADLVSRLIDGVEGM